MQEEKTQKKSDFANLQQFKVFCELLISGTDGQRKQIIEKFGVDAVWKETGKTFLTGICSDTNETHKAQWNF